MIKVILRLIQATLLIITFLFTITHFTFAQPVIGFTNFIGSGFSSEPVDIANAGDGTNRLFIVEKRGGIRIHNGTTLLTTPFLNINSIISFDGERGLLSLAFHPDYENNRYFFVYYTNLAGDITISRYQTQAGNPNEADAGSGVVLLNIPKPFDNHNGGDLNFGPDGYLYFGTGDGGSGGDPNNFAQSGSSLLGKMIRIDVNNFLTPPFYTIPPDNPYVADPNVDDRIWALGLRNPWRWSFDRNTNDMWIADVGEGSWEEVNFRTAGNTGGINYGWRCYQGNAPLNPAGCLPQSNYTFPIFEYPHDNAIGGFSITGGFVYRGAEYPALQGYYICVDFFSGNLWLIRPDGAGGWTVRRQEGLPANITSFGEAENGTLYALSIAGILYKVDVTAILPVTLTSFSGTKQPGYNEVKWNTATVQNVNRFIIEYSRNGSSYLTAGEVPAVNQTNDRQYSFRHYNPEPGKLFYRLRIEDNDGAVTYSPVITIAGKENGSIKVFPTIITNNVLQVLAEKEVTRINITDSYGRRILTKDINGLQGYFTVTLPALSRGMYWVQLQSASGNETVKVIVQ
jgi:glucose/arabinose dehydrogenase